MYARSCEISGPWTRLAKNSTHRCAVAGSCGYVSDRKTVTVSPVEAVYAPPQTAAASSRARAFGFSVVKREEAYARVPSPRAAAVEASAVVLCASTAAVAATAKRIAAFVTPGTTAECHGFLRNR